MQTVNACKIENSEIWGKALQKRSLRKPVTLVNL